MFHLELHLDLHLQFVSHLFLEREPKCPTVSAGLARSSKKLPKRSSWVSKYGPRVIKMAAECVRMQPAGPKNMLSKVTPRKMKADRPLGPRKVAQGCPNTDRGAQKWSPRIARCKSDMLIYACTHICIYIYIKLYTYTYERLPASMIHDTQHPCTFFKGRRQCFAHQYIYIYECFRLSRFWCVKVGKFSGSILSNSQKTTYFYSKYKSI